MSQTGSIALNIIILAYYTPALLVSLYVSYKHGFDRRAGWLNLIFLDLFRLVGSILSLVAIYSPSRQVVTGSLVLSNLGTVSLVGALIGISSRANSWLGPKGLPPRLTFISHIVLLAAVVLGIVAAVQDGANYTESDLAKGAIILLVAGYALAVFICAQTFISKQMVPHGERALLYASTLSLPPVLVRLIYSLILEFGSHTGAFSVTSTSDSAIIVKAIMAILMEFIAVALFLWAGCTVDKSPERQAQRHRIVASKDEEFNLHEAMPPQSVYTQKPSNAPAY